MAAGRRITKTDVEKLLNAIKKGAGITLASKAIGVSRQSVHQRMKRDPEFREQIDGARAVVDEIVVYGLFERARTETSAAIFWLKNRCPDEWSNLDQPRGVAGGASAQEIGMAIVAAQRQVEASVPSKPPKPTGGK